MSDQQKLTFYCPFCKEETWHTKEDKYFDGSGTRYRCTRCRSLIEKGSIIENIETYMRWCEEGTRAGFKKLKEEFGLNYEEIKDKPMDQILDEVEA